MQTLAAREPPVPRHRRRLRSEIMSASSLLLPSDPAGRPRLKVAFVGTHGVVKTARFVELAAQLTRIDLGVDVVKEVARRCPLPINEGTTYDAQAWSRRPSSARICAGLRNGGSQPPAVRATRLSTLVLSVLSLPEPTSTGSFGCRGLGLQ